MTRPRWITRTRAIGLLAPYEGHGLSDERIDELQSILDPKEYRDAMEEARRERADLELSRLVRMGTVRVTKKAICEDDVEAVVEARLAAKRRRRQLALRRPPALSKPSTEPADPPPPAAKTKRARTSKYAPFAKEYLAAKKQDDTLTLNGWVMSNAPQIREALKGRGVPNEDSSIVSRIQRVINQALAAKAPKKAE